MIKRAFKRTTTVSLLCLFSSYTVAADFNYNYFEFRAGTSPQSVGGEFSTSVTDNFHVLGSMDTQMDDDWNIAAGVGFNGPVSPLADVFGALLAHQIKYPKDMNNGNYDTLMELHIGLRAWVSDQLEGYGKIGKLDRHSVIAAGVRFHSTDQLSMNMEISNNGIWGSQALLGVRFEF